MNEAFHLKLSLPRSIPEHRPHAGLLRRFPGSGRTGCINSADQSKEFHDFLLVLQSALQHGIEADIINMEEHFQVFQYRVVDPGSHAAAGCDQSGAPSDFGALCSQFLKPLFFCGKCIRQHRSEVFRPTDQADDCLEAANRGFRHFLHGHVDPEISDEDRDQHEDSGKGPEKQQHKCRRSQQAERDETVSTHRFSVTDLSYIVAEGTALHMPDARKGH